MAAFSMSLAEQTPGEKRRSVGSSTDRCASASHPLGARPASPWATPDQAAREKWCRHEESNPGPADYKSVSQGLYIKVLASLISCIFFELQGYSPGIRAIFRSAFGRGIAPANLPGTILIRQPHGCHAFRHSPIITAVPFAEEPKIPRPYSIF